MGNPNTTAIVEEFSTETGKVHATDEVSVWAVTADGVDQFETGVYIALDDGRGATITEETLAALGYVKA